MIRKFCARNNIKLFDWSLLKFTPVSFETIPEADWIFFYSQNGIRFFLDQLKDQELIRPYKIGCYGRSSANYFSTMTGIPCDFIGTGLVPETSSQYFNIVGQEKTLFIQARQSRASMQARIGDLINHTELIVYNNEINTEVELVSAGTLIFTSPLNVQSYISRMDINQIDQTIIAIGPSTRLALEEYNDVHQPPSPSEKDISELLTKICN